MVTTKYKVGTELPPLTKKMTQEKINLFESVTLENRANIHNDAAKAEQQTGMKQPFASGRMQLTFMSEVLRKFFGKEVFHKTGRLRTRNVRPVVSGDTLTVRGKVIELTPEGTGQRVVIELSVENQNGEKTGVGTGSAVVQG
jgi:acyl dehydratase